MVKHFLPLIFSQKFFEKLTAFSLLLFIGYFLRDFLALFFITFIFAYIFLGTGTSIAKKLHDWGLHGNKSRTKRIAAKYGTTNMVVTGLYILFVAVIILIFVNILPRIGNEINHLATNAPHLANQGQELIIKVENSVGINLGIETMVSNILSEQNIKDILQNALGYIKDAGSILMKFFIGLILSYIFIMERKKVQAFFKLMQDGSFSFLYQEYAIIANKISRSFGAIFKAQSIIALANSLFTIIGLLIIGWVFVGKTFPFIFTLSLIVFIFGFIPVFGTMLSGIPIIIIGYGFGGFGAVFAILIMILLVHAIEAYILNPKIVSSYVDFPVFITFIVLIVSEHFLGLIGLLIGVPLFSIFLSFSEDLDQHIAKIKYRHHIDHAESGNTP